MKVLYDTSIVLDVLLKREPFADIAIDLISAVKNKVIQGYLCATTLTTIDYLITKENGKNSAKKTIGFLLKLFDIADVNKTTLEIALNSDFSDFEDAVSYYSGVVAGEVGATRLNLILLTAASAVLGSMMIVLDPIFSGLAWSFIFGIIASTLFSLVVIPLVYFLIKRNMAKGVVEE